MNPSACRLQPNRSLLAVLAWVARTWLGCLAVTPFAVGATRTTPPSTSLVTATVEGRWIRPAPATADHPTREPLWGHADGLRIGLAHSYVRPRGLLRVYSPDLGNPAGHVINYIAVEPVLAGQKQRGYSELEHSRLDDLPGKRFWSAADPADRTPRLALEPVRGEVTQIDGVECLRVWIQVEPFDNGAHVYVRLTFRADRPHEVALATFAHDDSKPLAACILTATMGNYARLRKLQLAGGETAVSLQLWPDHRGDGFTPHARFPLSRLPRLADGAVVVTAIPDEADPAVADHAPGTREFWRYTGRVAAQSWRCAQPDPALEVLVNGRSVFWNSKSPIPGGVAFENFEMLAPFRQGAEFIFAVEAIAPPTDQPSP